MQFNSNWFSAGNYYPGRIFWYELVQANSKQYHEPLPKTIFRDGYNQTTPRNDILNISTYRGTSLTKKRTLLGPYRRHMPRVLGGS